MQRLFVRYVGVSPKSVIQRYRLHEAAQMIDQGAVSDWLDLSIALGYYDHSHFIRDFRAIVGVSPQEYRAALRNFIIVNKVPCDVAFSRWRGLFVLPR